MKKKKEIKEDERYSIHDENEYNEVHVAPVEKSEPEKSIIKNGYYTGKLKYGYAEQVGDEHGPFNENKKKTEKREKRRRKKR